MVTALTIGRKGGPDDDDDASLRSRIGITARFGAISSHNDRDMSVSTLR